MSPLAKYRTSLSIFIVGLALSGVTAFPLLTELSVLARLLGIVDPSHYASMTGVRHWIAFVDFGLQTTYTTFPFIGYGTDWLAFGHLVIAMFFVGPLVRPSRNDWVLYCGLVACIGVVPLALICGSIRGIPFYWSLLDSSFGILGAIPLVYCLYQSWIIQKIDANHQATLSIKGIDS